VNPVTTLTFRHKKKVYQYLFKITSCCTAGVVSRRSLEATL